MVAASLHEETAAVIGETTARSRREEFVDVTADLSLLLPKRARDQHRRWLPLAEAQQSTLRA
jgi:hypothetical protein